MLGVVEMVDAAHRLVLVLGFLVALHHGDNESPGEGWLTHLNADRTFCVVVINAPGMQLRAWLFERKQGDRSDRLGSDMVQ